MTKTDLKFYPSPKWKSVQGKPMSVHLCMTHMYFYRSEIFLRSAGSSWSMNINLERVIEDRNLRDLQNTQLLEDE